MRTEAVAAAPRVAVVWQDPAPGPVLEGGRARRLGLIAGLRGSAHLHALRRPSNSGWPSRLKVFILNFVDIQNIIFLGECEALLLFYPDLPGFLPARTFKLLIVLPWLLAMRAVMALKGMRLLVDVGDIPRWQGPSLHLESRVGAGYWRLLELVLFGVADRVTVATRQLGDRLARDLGLPRGRFVTLPNAGASGLLRQRRAARRVDRARFVYLGNLDHLQDRGIRALCSAFLAHARGAVELVLIGEGGGWIAREFPSPRIRVLPALPEPQCAGWLASSDFALIPYPTSGYYRTVCPAKLPLYALARVPIISTPLEATKEVIERHALGECMEPAAAFAGWRALARRYRGFRGGRDLGALTWERAAESLL